MRRIDALAALGWCEDGSDLLPLLRDLRAYVEAAARQPAPVDVEALAKRAEHAERWAASARDDLDRLGVPNRSQLEDGREVVLTGAERVRLAYLAQPTEKKR